MAKYDVSFRRSANGCVQKTIVTADSAAQAREKVKSNNASVKELKIIAVVKK